MKKFITNFLAVLVFTGWATTSRASIIYNLVDYSDATHTLSGTITTDGTLGLLGIANITAWTVSITGADNFSFSLTDPFASTSDFGNLASIDATSELITISGGGNLALIGGSSFLPQYRYEGGNAAVFGPLPTPILSYIEPVGSTGQYVFATASSVPLPATLTLFGLGLAGLGWSRRKKA